VIDGEFHDQFVVGVVQGGAGTSTNMNANEVITNIALELAAGRRATTRSSRRSTTPTARSRPTTSTRRR
jgi:aspartate ammonia-lyase